MVGRETWQVKVEKEAEVATVVEKAGAVKVCAARWCALCGLWILTMVLCLRLDGAWRMCAMCGGLRVCQHCAVSCVWWTCVVR